MDASLNNYVDSLPLWKERTQTVDINTGESRKPIPLKDVLKIRGAKEVLICFFCYCAVEQTSGLWASSFMHLYKGVPKDKAAGYASMFLSG